MRAVKQSTARNVMVFMTDSADHVAGTVSYSASAVEIDQAGTWLLQPVVTFPLSTVIPGTTVEMEISKRFT